MKFQQDADRRVEQSHGAQELGEMNREDLFDGPCFDDEAAVDKNLAAQRFLEDEVLIADRDATFAGGRNAAKVQFMQQAFFY